MRRILIISAAAHLGFLALLPILPNLGGHQPIAVEVFAVELVDVPNTEPVQETVEPPPAQESEPEPVPEENPIPEEPVRQKPVPKPITPPPPPRQEKSLEERLAERLKSVDAPKPQQESTKRPESKPQTVGTSTKISAGTVVSDYYLTMLQGKITRNWKQPSVRFSGSGDLTARVTFRVLRSGEMTALSVSKSSGWSAVDESARQAVRASAPFPELPSGYHGDHLDVTIDFTVTQ
jgi:periplasmic protein TonB